MANASRSLRPTPTSMCASPSRTTTQCHLEAGDLAAHLTVLDHDLEAGVAQGADEIERGLGGRRRHDGPRRVRPARRRSRRPATPLRWSCEASRRAEPERPRRFSTMRSTSVTACLSAHANTPPNARAGCSSTSTTARSSADERGAARVGAGAAEVAVEPRHGSDASTSLRSLARSSRDRWSAPEGGGHGSTRAAGHDDPSTGGRTVRMRLACGACRTASRTSRCDHRCRPASACR